MNKIEIQNRLAILKEKINNSYMNYDPNIDAFGIIKEDGFKELEEVNKLQNEFFSLKQRLRTAQERKLKIVKIYV